jgi:2-C-methyl-D-erythritol 4-phosphate cytidylyltransferase
MDTFAAIFPAAGRSVRFGQGRNKLLEPLGGVAVVARAVGAFLRRADVAYVVIATGERERIAAALRDGKINPEESNRRVRFTEGGASRAHSVREALEAVPGSVEWVAVHDAARPLVSQALIERTFAAARQRGAAVPALPVALTIKQAAGPLPARVERTVPRQTLWAMQTPQVMRRADLLDAFARCPIPLDQVTDDVQLLELTGRDIWLVEGEERNLKVTTATDLKVAELLLADEETT